MPRTTKRDVRKMYCTASMPSLPIGAFYHYEVEEVFDLVIHDEWPNAEYGDDECNLWSTLRRMLRQYDEMKAKAEIYEGMKRKAEDF